MNLYPQMHAVVQTVTHPHRPMDTPITVATIIGAHSVHACVPAYLPAQAKPATVTALNLLVIQTEGCSCVRCHLSTLSPVFVCDDTACALFVCFYVGQCCLL